ncbi:S9 family peptidase [Aurantiacibacter rhizosphaerae]|uniref:Prolyl oligopeptidase family serine peptidase n=1 Tax=Aurantiacibacter rhizosphaerae TaxID=2691582 RepID=A0A844XCL3_9SPHN|nr:S9 family peptidase [Aurantiacibacter rhizosphaerae]MWV27374.1 prolyl oligopeptidase family serine peptidase [Aurantiacibacter rhizosphaerae]
MTASTAAARVSDTPLIPRDHLFGNPTRSQGKISPDGKWVSWMAPWEGVMNVFMAPADDPENPRRMTSAKDRPIPGYFWAPDSESLMYVRDKEGDENFLLYQVGIAEGAQEKCLTPFEETRAQIIGSSNNIKDRFLVGLNNRDARFHDVHMLNLKTGKLELVFENNEWAGFEADDNLNLRWAVRQNAQGGTDMHLITDGKVEETPRERTGLDDSITTGMAGYTTDGKTLYWLDSRGRDTAALFAENTETGERALIAEHDKADIGGTMRHKQTGEVLAYNVAYLRTEHHAIDPEIGEAFAWLRERLEGDFGVQSRTDDDRRWLVANDPLTGPVASYLFDRDAMTLTKFYTTQPELEGAPLQPMHAREIKARDELILPSYLTLPPQCDDDGDGVPDAPVPMVLVVHGGPWARDGYGYNRTHQWLANRGYAVLSVNFRGSAGFGKGFISAGDKEWSGKMHDDLLDAVDWAVAEGIAEKDKVAIMGGSYGGYATLVGLTFTPEVFACGVDIVGPSNLETLLETIPPYWEPLIKQFHERMGDPTTPEGLEFLKSISPLYKASEITKPLLIGQGANDPRVKQAESDQIVEAMERDGVPVTYVLFPDEGHGFHRPENNIAFNAITENFLAECIGGRAEPVGDVLEASTAQIPNGKAHVGL